jgi:hypothetical protein
MTTTHHLKCWPDFFDAIKRGDKTFEVRKNDRGYQRGDALVLHKWDPTPSMGGRHYKLGGDYVQQAEHADTLRLDVTYVLSGFGIEPGFVCLGINRPESQP